MGPRPAQLFPVHERSTAKVISFSNPGTEIGTADSQIDTDDEEIVEKGNWLS
jgi:hypothetical protein